MIRENLSRRGFLQRTLAALMAGGCSRGKEPPAGNWFPEWYARELAGAREVREARPKKPVAAYDRLQLGVIGTGMQGKYLISRAQGQEGVQVVAVCDVDTRHRAEAAEGWANKCAQYKDFRELLARRDLHAVVIATPDHWHALIALAAMKAGKDVYCEKPLTLTIAEGQALVRVARATGRVLQVGSLQRSEYPQFRLACDLVRNGRLGRLKAIRTLIGSNPKGGPFPIAPVPEELDWDFWLGPAPKVDYVKQRCHGQFRWWYEYSGGKLTDWGAHHLDIAQWALDMDGSGPVTVEATGEEPSQLPNSFNCHPHFQVTYNYANGVELHCTSEQNGVRFEGENGDWVFASRDLRRCNASNPRLVEEPLPSDASRLVVSTEDHMDNFLECVRSRKRPICDVEVGHRTATVCHLGAIALRTGKKLQWDPSKEEFTGNPEMNGWLGREMRAPWKLEG